MPNMDWDNLTKVQLGWTAKYYFMMEFASYGITVEPANTCDQPFDFTI